ncbi:hypothetical protein JCM21900_006698 [Sporobolomyces salmonicolor]
MLRTAPLVRRSLQARAVPAARLFATKPIPPPAPVAPLLQPDAPPALPNPEPIVQPVRPAPPAPTYPPSPPAKSRFRSFLLSTGLFLGTSAFLLYAYDSRAGVHRWFAVPALMALTKDDPERAHEIAVSVLGSGLSPVDCGVDDERLAFELWGQKFSNPIGIAAGFDKHGQAIDGLFELGFGYVEIGSVTPVPQSGNPKPRVFRVPETHSVVNRYGFNSEGHDAVISRLRRRVERWLSKYASVLPSTLFPSPTSDAPVVPGEFDPVSSLLSSPAGQAAAPVDSLGLARSLKEGKVLGINLGKNKVSDPDSIDDFVKGIHSLGPYADVLIVNVSSPNTPGLRNLQRKGMLSELLEGVVAARNELSSSVKPPVLVKVAPDLTDDQIEDIAYAVKSSGVDGVIVSNTTISRPASAGSSPTLKETGGLSGPPVKPLALKALSALYEQTDGQVPLIGCGGISSGADALEFAKAGASLVQLYTGFVYGGVGLPRQIKDELAALLKKEGKTWGEVIGTGRVKKEEPVVAAPAKVEEAKPKPTTEDFEKSLNEAKAELEDLLKELAAAEQLPATTASPAGIAPASIVVPPPTPTPTSAAPSAPLEPAVAVPAPVAESTVDATTVHSLTTPSSAPAPASGGTSPAAPSSAGGPSSEKIDESPVAVPAQALLDENALAALLDPAKAQVEAGIAPSEKESVKEKPKEEKRWV